MCCLSFQASTACPLDKAEIEMFLRSVKGRALNCLLENRQALKASFSVQFWCWNDQRQRRSFILNKMYVASCFYFIRSLAWVFGKRDVFVCLC